MKTYQSITEWLESKPTKDEMDKILFLINRKTFRFIRDDIYKKSSVLKKMKQMKDYLLSQGVKEDKVLSDKIKEIDNEITQLKKMIPTPKPKRNKVLSDVDEKKVDSNIK